MTPDEYREILSEVSVTVLEDAAFLFVEPTARNITWNGEVIEANLSLTGPRSALLTLAATKELGIELAANLLGLDEDEASSIEKPAEASLAEMLNMIAGPLAAEWFGSDIDCKIGVPTTVTKTGSSLKRKTDAESCSVILVTDEGDPIELTASFS